MNVLRKVVGYIAIFIASVWVLLDFVLPLGGSEVYQHTIPATCKALNGYLLSMCIAEIFGRYLLVPLVGLVGYAILPKTKRVVEEEVNFTNSDPRKSQKDVLMSQQNDSNLISISNNYLDYNIPKPETSLVSQINSQESVLKKTLFDSAGHDYPNDSILKNFSKAEMAITYRTDVAETWHRIESFSSELVLEFLNALELDPKLHVQTLEAEITGKHKKLVSPFDDDRLTALYLDLQSLNIEAADEFVKVLGLLGDTINAEDLATKLQNKFS